MMEERKIYIIFSYTGTMFSKLLKFILNDKYVHVSICFDEKLTTVYSFGRKNPKIMFPCGLINEDVKLIGKVFKESICQVYELKVEKDKYRILKKELEKFISNKEIYRYNILGLIPLNFNIIFHRRKHFVCSQFVGKLLQDSGVCDLKKDYSLIKPGDIGSIGNLNKIYEGKIINYNF